MRFLGWSLVALLLANAGIYGLHRSLLEERAVLAELASEQVRESSQARASLERVQALRAIVETARESARTPSNLGELREMILSAEDGLPVERLSLEIRPDERLPPGFGGSRVQASLQGSFGALYEYLARVEGMFLPLSPENLSLRGDGARLTLTVRWAALWPLPTDGSSSANAELNALELDQLSRWLSRESPTRLQRNPFAVRSAGAPVSRPSVVEAPELPAQPPALEAAPEQPVLTGFVLARPELEPDVRRRVLAALRYAGETRLLMVGDSVGAYRIDSMQARDSVTLEHSETGERVRLTLEH